MSQLTRYITISVLLLCATGNATTDKFRLTLRDDPSTTITIGFNVVDGAGQMVYWDTIDYGTVSSLYANSNAPDRQVTHKGMNNHFVRLTGLQPDKEYYFIVEDSNSTSARYWFKTCPNAPGSRLAFIAGGDSRNNQVQRRNGNTIVKALRPHAVFFGGDMTNGNSDAEWQTWFDDWQFTNGADGRLIPIVAARGNHEASDAEIYNLFDVRGASAYYALTFGSNLIRTYTLNTESSIAGAQTTWLGSDLTTNAGVIWKMAQYHKPIRPHVAGKAEGVNQYIHWAPLFLQHQVKLVVECDAHTAKTTFPIIPSTGSGSGEGFIRDDSLGTVYVGEGCWGAPLRADDDVKQWTRASGRFNQIKWIFVDDCRIEVRTVLTDNAGGVGVVIDKDIFTAPSGLNVWNPPTGEVVYIDQVDAPGVNVTSPLQGTSYANSQQITISASANSQNSVSAVNFYFNDTLIGSDATAPYSVLWTPPHLGTFDISAEVIDQNCQILSEEIEVSFGWSTGVKEVGPREFILFPNPTQGNVEIRSWYDIESVRIFSLEGKLMFEEEYKPSSVVLVSAGSFPTGVYVIHVSTNNGDYFDKIILKH